MCYELIACNGATFIGGKGHSSVEHTHLEPGHHSLLHFEGHTLVKECQSGQVFQQEPKMSLKGSNDWLGKGLVQVPLEDFQQAQVDERNLGGKRGLIPGSSVKQQLEEAQWEKGLDIPSCHMDQRLDLRLEEEELEGVQGLGHPPGVMSSARRLERGQDVFPTLVDVAEQQQLLVIISRVLILQGPFQP